VNQVQNRYLVVTAVIRRWLRAEVERLWRGCHGMVERLGGVDMPGPMGWRRKAHELVHAVDGGSGMVLDGRARAGMGTPPADSIDTPWSRSRPYSFLNEKISRRSKAPLGYSSVQR
jgi:hypothetical protein